MRGSRILRQGGVQVSLPKKADVFFFFFFFFLSPQLILQKSNGQFKRNLSFFKVPEGVQHFPGGSNFFQGGSNCWFPIETHITCDFPGGVRTPFPPPPLWIRTCSYSSQILFSLLLSHHLSQHKLKFWTGIRQKIICGIVLVGMDS